MFLELIVDFKESQIIPLKPVQIFWKLYVSFTNKKNYIHMITMN